MHFIPGELVPSIFGADRNLIRGARNIAFRESQVYNCYRLNSEIIASTTEKSDKACWVNIAMIKRKAAGSAFNQDNSDAQFDARIHAKSLCSFPGKG
ncbi:hypothetical protein [Paraburkholderia caledonica]|uniref:hypothetical protein n=1 Tax=Paraburkholderia caledonica TaxID=134536 RepID=UPI0013E0A8BA|nr:hypothetical protein [Paraburkholderia caledonica]